MKILDDYKAFVNGGSIGKKIGVLISPCFHSVCLYRFSNFMYSIHMGWLSKIVWYINRMLFHVDIDYRSNLAGGFVLVHGLGTVIGKEVCSEGKLPVYQGVTIGGNKGKIRVDEEGNVWRQPLLGKDVIIYSGAALFGPIIIADGVEVKAGSIISKDIY